MTGSRLGSMRGKVFNSISLCCCVEDHRGLVWLPTLDASSASLCSKMESGLTKFVLETKDINIIPAPGPQSQFAELPKLESTLVEIDFLT